MTELYRLDWTQCCWQDVKIQVLSNSTLDRVHTQATLLIENDERLLHSYCIDKIVSLFLECLLTAYV